MRRDPLRAFARSRRATSATEFALVLPVMLLLIAGIVELGRFLVIYETVNRIATRYAISWADCSDTVVGLCGTEMALYVTSGATSNMAPQLTNTLSLRMLEVQISASSSANVVYAYPANATPTSDELTLAKNIIGSGNTGVIVSASYPHTFLFFPNIVSTFFGSSVTISYSLAQRKA